MAFPKLLQKLFQSDGAGDKLREDIMPKEYLPLTGGTVTGDLGVEGSITGQRLRLDNGTNNNLDFWANSNGDGGFFLAGDDHTEGDWVQILTANSSGVGGICPPGTMVAYAGKSVPWGWLLCNGANVSRTSYAKLFAAIGTTWGSGDGSTTFTLPNCSNRFLEGTTSTSAVGTYLSAGLPNITGTTCRSIGWAGLCSNASGAFNSWYAYNHHMYIEATSSASDGELASDFYASRSNSIYSASDTVQPAAVQILMIIKV